MRHAEKFRDTIIACYDAYNADRGAVARSSSGRCRRPPVGRRRLPADVLDLRGGGKATGEIAQAISDVAEGAERQARMAEEAQRSAEEIARAVAESAQNAERTAEVATNAHAVAREGVEAAEQADRGDAIGAHLEPGGHRRDP